MFWPIIITLHIGLPDKVIAIKLLYKEFERRGDGIIPIIKVIGIVSYIWTCRRGVKVIFTADKEDFCLDIQISFSIPPTSLTAKD